LDCYWRKSKNTTSAQLYNLTADVSETNNLASAEPDTVAKILARLDFWEQQTVDPYAAHSIDKACGEGKPQGTPPHWDSWC